MSVLSGVGRMMIFLLSSSFFPLALSSYGNTNVFRYSSSPLFSIASGFLFHQMVGQHQLIAENNVNVNSKCSIVLICYYCLLYVSGMLWSLLFINERDEVKMEAQTFIFLPIVNSLVFSFLFAVRYLFLKLATSDQSIEKELRSNSHPSGLSNFQLKSQQEYQSLLLAKAQTISKRSKVSIHSSEGTDGVAEGQGIGAMGSKEQPDFLIENEKGKNNLVSQMSSMNNFRIFHLENQNSLPNLKAEEEEEDEQKNEKQIRFQKILFGIQLIFTVLILQIVFGVNIPKVFDFMLSKSPYFIYIVCLGYPILIGLIKSINVLVNSVMDLRYEWQLQFLSLFFAGLPYRALYLTFHAFEIGFVIILIKFFYKLLVYYVQFRFANQVFNIKFNVSALISEIKDERTKKKEAKLPVQGQEKVNNKKSSKKKETDPELDKLKQRSQSHQELVYKFEILQFSDTLHLCGVFLALLLNLWVSDSELEVQKQFRDNFIPILILFVIELVSELIFTYLISNQIGKVEHFNGFSIVQFIQDINNFARINMALIFASVLCGYSILFIVFNN